MKGSRQTSSPSQSIRWRASTWRCSRPSFWSSPERWPPPGSAPRWRTRERASCRQTSWPKTRGISDRLTVWCWLKRISSFQLLMSLPLACHKQTKWRLANLKHLELSLLTKTQPLEHWPFETQRRFYNKKVHLKGGQYWLHSLRCSAEGTCWLWVALRPLRHE